MSTSGTTLTYLQQNRDLQKQVSFVSHNDNDKSPIEQYMKRTGFYNSRQQQTVKKVSLIKSQQDSLSNLKQFQKSVQKQKTTQEQLLSRKVDLSPQKARNLSPSVINRYSPQQEVDEDQVTRFRASETQNYGDKIMDKIKGFILDEDPSRYKRTPTKKKVEDSAYMISSSIQKLHEEQRRTQSARREQYVSKFFYGQMRETKQFKVTNPKSLYLIQKQQMRQGSQKPLYQRSVQMARQKNQTVLQRQFRKQQQLRIREEEQFEKYEQIRKLKYANSMTKEKQQQFCSQLAGKEKIKNQAKQHEKLKRFKQITRDKPFVSKLSKQLFNRILQRDEFSRDFLERNQQYKAYRQKEKLRELDQYDREYYPFTPKISETTHQLAQNYYKRKQQQKQHQRWQQRQQQKQQQQQKYKFKQKQLSKGIDKQKSVQKSKQIGQKTMINRTRGYNMDSSQNKGQGDQIKDRTRPSNNQAYNECNAIKFQSQQKQIPIYNRINHQRKRTKSCFNINSRK